MQSYAAPPHKRRRYEASASASASSALHSDESFGLQSLPVAILPHDFSGEPTDGEEYLAVVRREAAAAPAIFFATHNPYAEQESLRQAASSSSASTTIECSDTRLAKSASTNDCALCMPSLEWKQAFELQFKNARESLSNPPTHAVKLTKDDLPKISNITAWYAWIHGRPPPPTSAEEAEKQTSKNYQWRTREPSGPLLLRLNTEHILGLLEAFPYWIAHRVCIPDSQTKKEDRRQTEVLQPLHARWIFALLLRLDGRLMSEEISTLRTLARACVAAITLSRIRRKALSSRSSMKQTQLPPGAATEKAEGERRDKDEEEEQVVQEDEEEEEKRMRRDEAGAWMVVAIVAGVWGQSDLWEDARTDMKRVA